MISIFYPVFLFVCNLILGMFLCRDILIVIYTSHQSFMIPTLLDLSARKYIFLEKKTHIASSLLNSSVKSSLTWII